MIWRIVRKELLVNLLSLRFAIGLIITLGMMGIVGYVLLQEYAARQQTYFSETQRHREELAQNKVYSTIAVTVDIPPSPLSIFSRGTKDLPASFNVSAFHIPSLVGSKATDIAIGLWGNSLRPYNPLLRVFSTIDLSFVISIILSFFALLLVFDSFSGEREQGTLPMIMSYPVGRLEVLAGKFLGALLTLALPLTLGFVEVLLLWSFSAEIEINSAVWSGLGVIYLVSLLYLSGFIALGLLFSLWFQSSAPALIYLLLVWVANAVVIPQGGEYLAQYARPQQSRQEVVSEMERFYQEFEVAREKLGYEQRGVWYYNNTEEDGIQSLLTTTEAEAHNLGAYHQKLFPLKLRFVEESYRTAEHYEAVLRQWGVLRDRLTSPSLSSLYQRTTQALAGTDIENYRAILSQGRSYREQLVDYLRPQTSKPAWFTRVLEYPHLLVTEGRLEEWEEMRREEGEGALEKKIFTWDPIAPLDLSAMPSPQIDYPGLAQRLAGVSAELVLSSVITALLLGLAAWRASNYSVR